MAEQNWEIRFSNSRKRPYFYSHATQESVWDTPAGLTPEQIEALPGANLLSYSDVPEPPKPTTANGKVRASHLLIKHAGSRRPSSWRTENITRTKEEAIEILKAHQANLKKNVDLVKAFGDLARTESDCSSAREGGDLGEFGPRQMQKPFEDASFSTPIGTMSDIISTDSGVHLILRTG